MICIFTNDSYFAYLLAKDTFMKHYLVISDVFFSEKIVKSITGIINVLRKASFEYFIYRSFVQILGIYKNIFYRETIMALCKDYGIQKHSVRDINTEIGLIASKKRTLGVIFNFDQILSEEIINLFDYGILNIHGSKLPEYRGISPVLWAFANGDDEIWVTVYKVGSVIDTGSILTQFKIPVEPSDSAFSLYERVCIESGKIVAGILENYIEGDVQKGELSESQGGKYCGWPDRSHAQLMKRNKRHYIKASDIVRALRGKE